jgi:hypothetical protein
VEFVWNAQNFWVCMQMPRPDSDSRAAPKDVTWALHDPAKWQALLEDRTSATRVGGLAQLAQLACCMQLAAPSSAHLSDAGCTLRCHPLLRITSCVFCCHLTRAVGTPPSPLPAQLIGDMDAELEATSHQLASVRSHTPGLQSMRSGMMPARVPRTPGGNLARQPTAPGTPLSSMVGAAAAGEHSLVVVEGPLNEALTAGFAAAGPHSQPGDWQTHGGDQQRRQPGG